ncbi:hypothetical protein KC963_04760 [Candidatus Saccharibacteria bacterium]|nr:hypothetical protein [Candidatus Saccharibacteria bacterium]
MRNERQDYTSPRIYKHVLAAEARHRRDNARRMMIENRASILANFERLKQADFPSTQLLERHIYTKSRVIGLGAILCLRSVDFGWRGSDIVTGLHEGYVLHAAREVTVYDSRIEGPDGGGSYTHTDDIAFDTTGRIFAMGFDDVSEEARGCTTISRSLGSIRGYSTSLALLDIKMEALVERVLPTSTES